MSILQAILTLQAFFCLLVVAIIVQDHILPRVKRPRRPPRPYDHKGSV